MGIQFASVMVLSRLLSPEDFGLVALSAVFISTGALLRDFGLPTIALQVRTLSNSQASNLFYITLGLGLAASAVLVVAAPLLAVLFDEERLTGLLRVMAIALVLGGASAQYQVHLARSLKFTALAAAEVVSSVVGLGVAIIAAMVGWGYWALAAQTVTIALVLLVAQVAAARWAPALPRRGEGTRHLLGLGANYGVAQLLTFVSSNADTVLVSARWGATDVGYYNRAFQLLTLPVQALLHPLTNVVVPLVNREREAGTPVDASLLRVQFAVGSAGVGVFLAAIIAADGVIPLLLGPGWDETTVLFRILAVGGAVQILSFVSYWSFMLHNQSRQLLYYNLVTKTMAVGLLVWGSSVSLTAVAAAYSAGLVLSWPINLLWLARCAGQRSLPFFASGVRILAAAVAGGCAGWAILVVSSELPNLFQAVLGVIGAAAIYLLGLAATPIGRRDLRDVARVARGVLRRG
jgi:PST family polysaccharide transporter